MAKPGIPEAFSLLPLIEGMIFARPLSNTSRVLITLSGIQRRPTVAGLLFTGFPATAGRPPNNPVKIMDQKVTPESFKAYRDWQRYILGTMPKLSAGCRRVTLIAYCLAMASHGANGQRCFAGDPTLAREIGLNQAKLVRPYRHEALRLGWFVLTGEHRNRVKVLDIAIPGDGGYSPENKPAVAEHDTSVPEANCEACKPLIPKLYANEMTMDELRSAHLGWDGV